MSSHGLHDRETRNRRRKALPIAPDGLTDRNEIRARACERLRGDSEDDIVEVSLAHLGERHPGLTYEREHILFMTTKFRR